MYQKQSKYKRIEQELHYYKFKIKNTENMKYLKRFRNEAAYEQFLGGGEEIIPHIFAVESETGKTSVKFKKYVAPTPKTVNYVKAYINGLKWYMEWDYPVDSDVYVYDDAFGKIWFKKGEQIKSSVAPPATTTVIIYAIALTSGELDLYLQECEDDTYIYRIKNN